MKGALPKLAILCSALAVVLVAVIVPQMKASDVRDTDVLSSVLGGTADLAAERAYQQADTYFHAGMMDHCPDVGSGHHEEAEDHEAAGHHEEAEPEEEAGNTASDLPLGHFISGIYKQTEPRKHMHLEGATEKELLPWFIVAVRLNPHHVEAWRTGTYWFYRSGDLKRAEEFIARAIKNNPKRYELLLEQGILYHRMHKWQDSISALEKAGKLWKDNSDDAPYEMNSIRTYLDDARKHLKD